VFSAKFGRKILWPKYLGRKYLGGKILWPSVPVVLKINTQEKSTELPDIPHKIIISKNFGRKFL